MDKKHKNPAVRFKGFNDDWENKVLGDFGKVAMNKRIFKYQTSEIGEIPFYKIGSFGGVADAYITRKIFEEYKSKYPYPNYGDILISASGSIGRVVEYLGKDQYFQDSNIVWLDHNGTIDNQFLKQYYSIIKWNGLEGSTIKRLYNKSILLTPIGTPSLTEQKQIGVFFQNLDNLIKLHQKKYDKLVILKKAMLVKMFPKKGAFVPEIRFKGFSGDWEHSDLNKTSWFQEGPGLRNWQFTQQGIKVINVTNLVNGVLKLENTSRHISNSEFEKTYKHFEIQANDIVVASSGNSYGKVSIVRESDLPLLMNTSVIRFKPLLNLDFNYLLLFLKSDMFKNQIDLLITGGAQPNFGPVHLNKLKINLPPKIDEQQKIGKYFQNLNNQIDLHKTQLDKLNTIKKACFSKMFVAQD